MTVIRMTSHSSCSVEYLITLTRVVREDLVKHFLKINEVRKV